MSRRARVFRAYDSRGTVHVTGAENLAVEYREMGYPVEVYEAEYGSRDALLDLDGGRGPSYLSGVDAERLGDFDEVVGR